MLSNFKHSVDNTKARLVSLWGDEEQRFEARDVLWTADRITDAPVVSITSPSTILYRTKSREERDFRVYRQRPKILRCAPLLVVTFFINLFCISFYKLWSHSKVICSETQHRRKCLRRYSIDSNIFSMYSSHSQKNRKKGMNTDISPWRQRKF